MIKATEAFKKIWNDRLSFLVHRAGNTRVIGPDKHLRELRDFFLALSLSH
jgi:hypothetical protein